MISNQSKSEAQVCLCVSLLLNEDISFRQVFSLFSLKIQPRFVVGAREWKTCFWNVVARFTTGIVDISKSEFLLQPPLCNEISRRKRDSSKGQGSGKEVGLDGETPATIEVYSGLQVNEASDLSSKSDYVDDVFRERVRLRVNLNSSIICAITLLFFYH